MPYTLGFIDHFERAEHFYWHVTRNRNFACATDLEYEQLADGFVGPVLPRPLDTGMWECYRTNRDRTRGDYIRYNEVTEEYCVLGRNNVIRTYFIPDPAEHGFPTNLDYFRWDCGRVKA